MLADVSLVTLSLNFFLQVFPFFLDFSLYLGFFS